MRKRIVGFIGSMEIGSNFFVGILAGVMLSIIMSLSPDWNIYLFLMFVVWASMLLILDPVVSLGFILSFCPIIFSAEPKGRMEITISFFIFFLIIFCIYYKKAPK